MTANIEGKKVPGFIKKFNKFLGLPSKSNRILDILKINGNEENIAKNMADIAKYHPDETSKLINMYNFIWQNFYNNKRYP